MLANIVVTLFVHTSIVPWGALEDISADVAPKGLAFERWETLTERLLSLEWLVVVHEGMPIFAPPSIGSTRSRSSICIIHIVWLLSGATLRLSCCSFPCFPFCLCKFSLKLFNTGFQICVLWSQDLHYSLKLLITRVICYFWSQQVAFASLALQIDRITLSEPVLAQLINWRKLILRFARAPLDFARDTIATGLPVVQAILILELSAASFTPKHDRVERLQDKPIQLVV